ncbi:hypothetical protein BDZ94DRAFT_1301363 [Collybia nuda]|uniref:DUF6532 domain-containing protein n=1 Tax=Collybia nuda TaxID=64659 RepID=A0A9P6CAD1_9AGAR|nr:hypothetical protein BDZ94DRAFT_1301363 [Collybia nuda]
MPYVLSDPEIANLLSFFRAPPPQILDEGLLRLLQNLENVQVGTSGICADLTQSFPHSPDVNNPLGTIPVNDDNGPIHHPPSRTASRPLSTPSIPLPTSPAPGTVPPASPDTQEFRSVAPARPAALKHNPMCTSHPQSLEEDDFSPGHLGQPSQNGEVKEKEGPKLLGFVILNKGKADAGAFLTMLKNQQISESLLLLVVTSVEIAIKEWATGVQVKIHFSEEVVAPQYTHHKGVWNLLKVKCSSFPQYKLKSNFKAIMINAGFLFLLKINKACISELEGVDFDALESIATGSGENNGPTNILPESDPFI